MVRQFLVSLARQLNCRTLPEALRLMANQLQMIFDALFDHSDSFCPMPVSPMSRVRKLFLSRQLIHPAFPKREGGTIQSLSPFRREVWREVKTVLHPGENRYLYIS
ncbi:hypothetical protein [Nostoc sp. GT001]|uniref:hypothetical protein n=1 Tax=Nostoc sp. GT001 TaxID=3056647 RepID=UPI0025AAB8AB|nr:hypothetical protein [Nostoc sp. GT001]MDM9585040.1 hypothetical protein [Nostoc sp. GT001]